MDLSSHFRIMWRRRNVIVILTVLIAGVVLGYEYVQPKVYQAIAQLSVVVGPDQTNQATIQQDAVYYATVYADQALTTPVLTDAASRSHLGIGENTAGSRLSVLASATIGFITVTATGPSPAAATALASGMDGALIAAVNSSQVQARAAALAPLQAQLQQIGGQLQNLGPNDPNRPNLQTQYNNISQSITNQEATSLNQVSVIGPPAAGPAPVAPKPKSTAALAFVTALIVLAELMVVFELVSDRFSSVLGDEDVRQVTGLPVLAHVPDGEGPEMIEAFRTLRTNILFMDAAEEVRTIAVVSPDPGAGKSFVSLNLARSASESGVTTVVIDGDLRRPILDRKLRLPRSPGLSEVLLGADISTAMHRVADENFLVAIPAGATVPDPAGLLGSQLRIRALQLLTQARVVVVDTPAGGLFPDASTIASQCDATILVIDAKSSKRRNVRAMLVRLSQVQVTPIGVVINRTKESPSGSEYYRRSDEDDVPATV